MHKIERTGWIPKSLSLRVVTRCPFATAFLAAAIVASSITHAMAADVQHCDRNLKPILGKLGYQWRMASQACEGLYEAKVSASLEIVSYLFGKLSFEPGVDKVLDISAAEIPALNSKQVFVRGVALPAGTYYRMDTTLQIPGSVNWSLNEVVAQAELGPDKLGVFGWIGSESDKIFVPLRIAPKGNQGAKGRQLLELQIRPTVDVDYAIWRAWTESNVSAGEGKMPHGARAGWPFSILIASGPPAVLHVEVTAKEANRDEWLPIRLRVMRAQ